MKIRLLWLFVSNIGSNRVAATKLNNRSSLSRNSQTVNSQSENDAEFNYRRTGNFRRNDIPILHSAKPNTLIKTKQTELVTHAQSLDCTYNNTAFARLYLHRVNYTFQKTLCFNLFYFFLWNYTFSTFDMPSHWNTIHAESVKEEKVFCVWSTWNSDFHSSGKIEAIIINLLLRFLFKIN